MTLIDSHLHRGDTRESLCPRCHADLDPENFCTECGATGAFRCVDPEAEWIADLADRTEER